MTPQPDHPSPAVTEATFHAFLRLWGLLRQAQEPYFARFGISASQWGILRVLQRAEGKGEFELPLKDVSQRLLIQPPSVTGTVDRLERLGFVKRTSSAADLRVRHLSLTPPGRELMDRILEGHPDRIQSLFAGLKPDEQETMLALLTRLEAHLRTLSATPARSPALPKRSARHTHSHPASSASGQSHARRSA
jgi:DNA-binding MarR family transcriptional regulator